MAAGDGTISGKLLVASPEMLDPNFTRAVILLLEHGEEGALGLTLTRPLDLDVVDVLPAWLPYLSAPPVVFAGGPVQREVAVGLARRFAEPSETWRPLPNGVGVIDLGLEPDEIVGVDMLRVFSGYAGWSPGQLELELAIGSWLVLDATDGDPFTTEPDDLWRRVLRRQRGAAAFYADYPEDIGLN